MEQLVSNYLKHLNIPISRKYCERLISIHPDYPSLLSIADTFEWLGIRHNVARIERTDLPYGFLSMADRESARFG